MSRNIFGFHSVQSLLTKSKELLELVYIDKSRQDKRVNILIEELNINDIPYEIVKDDKFKALGLEHVNHQGIVAKVKPRNVIDLKTFLDGQTSSNLNILVLDGITDPQNFGSIIRSADCFGIDAIIIPKNNSASPDNPIVDKVSSGAINFVPIIIVNNLSTSLDVLKEHDFWIYGTSLAPNSISLLDVKVTGNIAWVMGNEGMGLRRLVSEHCDYLVTIPMNGSTQSLNVSVATGVVLSYGSFNRK